MKIPAVTFAPTFFNRINYCEQIGLTKLNRCASLKEVADRLRGQIDNRAKFSSLLMANSFEGVLVDPVSMPSVMEEENIEMICQTFLSVVQNQIELDIA